jgi:heme-degrading monooxygenase HmoA
MYVIIWEYQVKAEFTAQFEESYSASGVWSRLFQKSKGYLGTELLAHEESPNRYITIDRWASSQDYASFLSEWKLEYADLDAQCEGLTAEETLLGKWETH